MDGKAPAQEQQREFHSPKSSPEQHLMRKEVSNHESRIVIEGGTWCYMAGYGFHHDEIYWWRFQQEDAEADDISKGEPGQEVPDLDGVGSPPSYYRTDNAKNDSHCHLRNMTRWASSKNCNQVTSRFEFVDLTFDGNLPEDN
jgi:hypothetical protein